MALMIDARQLKYSLQAADQAWQIVLKEDSRLVELRAKSSGSPVSFADRQAIEAQGQVLKKAKDVYAFLQATVVVELSSAILNAELRASNFYQATNNETSDTEQSRHAAKSF
ncbi:hypothetical protein [Pseudomonas canadensis]|uniref:hypothetical protein n=1 Tax=Pseudomonas canadensis TaxID=915099 RepID=UPI003BA2EAEB